MVDIFALEDGLKKAIWNRHTDFILKYTQGTLGAELIELLTHMEKRKLGFADFAGECYRFYKQLGEGEYTDAHREKLCERIMKVLDCSHELASKAIGINDFSDLLDEAALSMATARVKPSNFTYLREAREYRMRMKDMLVNNGGMGAQQAEFQVRCFEKDVHTLVDSYRMPDKPTYMGISL